MKIVIACLLVLAAVGGIDAIAGRTTRYWDCCKVSCAWPGKGPANPVNSCSANGINIIDPNTASGCDGGASYACNNNSPFVINDQLSYGFAAYGNTDANCCRCYSLQFTSGPVAGKTMIVQATNIGGDVAGNQFDLMIPGGGVGIFNGCQPQWNAPADGWGNRYGGVNSIGECDQLPAPLQDGCRWRFQWFMNADNPNVEFNEVACPNELIAISNCRA